MTNAPAIRQISNVRDLLRSEAARDQLSMVAAKQLSPDRVMRLLASAIQKTPTLQECEPMSLLGALMTASSLGLECNTTRGLAYLIPFKNRNKNITEVELVIGYKGYIDMAFRSGIMTYIDAGVHYSDDALWEYEKGMNALLRHAEGSQKGEKLHAYSIVKWNNPGGTEGMAMAVLPWSKIIQTRDQSSGWKSAKKYGRTAASAWTTSEDAMAMKTAIRALAQGGKMPMSVELQTALDVDSAPTDFTGFAISGKIEDIVGASANDGDPGEKSGAPTTGKSTRRPSDTAKEPDVIEGRADETENDQRYKNPKSSAKNVGKGDEKAKTTSAKPGDELSDDEEEGSDEAPAIDKETNAEIDAQQAAWDYANELMAEMIDAGATGTEKLLSDPSVKERLAALKTEFPAAYTNISDVASGLGVEMGEAD